MTRRSNNETTYLFDVFFCTLDSLKSLALAKIEAAFFASLLHKITLSIPYTLFYYKP